MRFHFLDFIYFLNHFSVAFSLFLILICVKMFEREKKRDGGSGGGGGRRRRAGKRRRASLVVERIHRILWWDPLCLGGDFVAGFECVVTLLFYPF